MKLPPGEQHWSSEMMPRAGIWNLWKAARDEDAANVPGGRYRYAHIIELRISKGGKSNLVRVEVWRGGKKGEVHETVMSRRALARLRSLYKNPERKGWRRYEGEFSVTFVHVCGEFVQPEVVDGRG